ncbi:MAG: succinate--CoA ligase subunit alpha [Alphaproteobacteria bacterium]|nr:succinate--CoA ligase subunit alpha [Alphaproteobacteria bacterium]
MAVLVDQNTRLLCQGMTGWAGTYHTDRMIQYGTKVVAGVTPGKGGRTHLGLPVFDTVAEAKQATDANASILFVPPATAGKAMVEAIEAEIPLVVVVTERIPVLDMVRVREALSGSKTRLIGPNSQGILAPEVCKIGVMATPRAKRGPIGVASRSATLTSEVVSQLTSVRLGQSTTIGIGGDPVHGVGFVDCLDLFFKDSQTEGVVLIGEIGGTEEQEAARYLRETGLKKPVVALVVGRAAPHECRMGHAGALAAQPSDDADAKIKALQDAGVIIASSAHLVGATMAEAFAQRAA